MIVRQNKYLAVETLDDPDTRVYHSRVRLLDEGLQVASANKGCGYLDFGRGPEHLPAVLASVLEFPGVASATLRAYHVVVAKSPVFDWGEVEKPILSMLEGAQNAVEFTTTMEQARDAFHNMSCSPIMWPAS